MQASADAGAAVQHGRLARIRPVRVVIAALVGVLIAAVVTVATDDAPVPVATPMVPDVSPAEVKSMMAVHDNASAERVRSELVAAVWPGGFPSTVLPDADGVVALPHGLDSHLRVLEPGGQPSCAVVVWHGHAADTPGVDELARGLADGGCVAVVGWMPMFGPNARPTVGPMRLARHDHLQMIDTAGEPALRYFLEPVAAAVNMIGQRWPGLPVSMTGLSGGGWTTTVYAAIDERVRLSIPVAGSLPNFLRTWGAEDWGDYEQQHPALPDYLDLYALAATDRRGQVQVLIDGDPCCFDAAGGRHLVYETTVDGIAGDLGGSFSVSVFRQDEHTIGPEMADSIVGLATTARGGPAEG